MTFHKYDVFLSRRSKRLISRVKKKEKEKESRATRLVKASDRFEVYLHGAYVRQSVERAVHNAGYSVPVQVPVWKWCSTGVIQFRLGEVIPFYARRHKSFYSQGLKIRQAGEHLVVNFSQPVLRQEPAKRELVYCTRTSAVYEILKRERERGKKERELTLHGGFSLRVDGNRCSCASLHLWNYGKFARELLLYRVWTVLSYFSWIAFRRERNGEF